MKEGHGSSFLLLVGEMTEMGAKFALLNRAYMGENLQVGSSIIMWLNTTAGNISCKIHYN